MRLCACMDIELDIIEPCGFLWDDRKIRKSGMDYINHVNLTRHNSWQDFYQSYKGKNRIILLSTKADVAYTDCTYNKGDILLMGRESAGVPDDIHENVDNRIIIPMKTGMRSLNIINSASMVIGEALRQTKGFPA